MNLPRRSAHVGTAALTCLAPLVALPAGGDLNAPYSGGSLPWHAQTSRVSLPFAGCFVCVVWSLPNARCLSSCHRRPSCEIPVRQRGFYQDPVPSPCLATYFTTPLAQPSCVPVPPLTTHFLDRGTLASLVAAPLHHPSDSHPSRRPVVSPTPSPPQVAPPQPRRLIDPPCVTCLLAGTIRVTATIDLDRSRRPSRKTLITVSRW